MVIPDCPSDKDITEGLKIINYSRNEKGEYEPTADHVWQPVNIVNHQAWHEIEKKIAWSRKKVATGRVSCLHYYMTANQMDISLLAQYTGQPRWKVRLHLLPFIFNRLPAATLKQYAELYKVSPDDLIKGRLLPPIYNRQ
jgi:hypothetical protein